MNKVIICHNPYDSSTYETFECEDVRELLKKQFLEWPKTAHIYHEQIAESFDITPYDEFGVDRLGKLSGTFYVVVYPEGIELIVAIVAIAVAAVAIGLAILLRPSPNVKNQQQASPNNSLGNRQNKERPNERIPDICGEVWSTPDLIQLPYRIFIGNREVEYSYMCIGRGEYDISKVRDDLTPFEDIDGASCEFYGPNTSPNSGDAPFLRIGSPINEKIKIVKAFTSANGQVLRAPNADKFKSNNDIVAVYPDSIITTGSTDFLDYFSVGSVSSPTHVIISGFTAKDPAGVHASVSLDGTYEIADIQGNEIVLVTPSTVNPNWSALASFAGQQSKAASPTLTSNDDRWIGPFTINEPDVNEIWCNFVCPNGLYELDKKANQWPMTVQVQVGIQAIDLSGAGVGAEVFYTGVIVGSALIRSQRGVTVKCPLPLPGPCKVRARRYSSTDLRDDWNVVDQTQWKDLYAVSPVTQTDFGNVTTVQVVNWPTQDALAIKERKFNCLIGHRIPKYRATHSSTGPYAVNDQNQSASWNESLKRLIWCTNHGTGATTSTFGILTNDVYSEITLTGISTGNSGGLGSDWILSDDNYIWIGQQSGYDTFKWYKYSISGGAPLATVGGIGPLSPYPGSPAIALATISGTQYVLHRRDQHIYRFASSDLHLVDAIHTLTGSGAIAQDASEHTWGFCSGGLFEIDWSGPTITNHTLAFSGGLIGLVYVAADNTILVATTTHLYKVSCSSATITNSISWTSSGISNIGVDGNIANGADIYSATTLALIQSNNPLSNFGATGTWGGLSPFLAYNSTASEVYARNTSNQVYQLYIGAPGFVVGTTAVSKNAGEILVAMALDPYIGNRQQSEVDIEGILAEIGPAGDNQAYFGTELCSEFCYTFDDSKVSFEEMAVDVCTAAFSTAYRRGSVLSVLFEKATNNSTLLFNHRNKIPRSETRTVSFGLPNDYDGIQLDFIDPHAPNQPDVDTTSTLWYPTDKSAKAPKKVTTIGVRNNVQAYMLGWRIYNKLLYQNTAIEFQATQEASACIINERVLVADNTRPETQDGQVESQSGLELTLSQDVTFTVGKTYTIFLQLYNGSVQSKAVTAGSASNKVVLASATSLPLVYDKTMFAQTTYIIVEDDSPREIACLISEKSAENGHIYNLKVVNYDDRYYAHDNDFIANLVSENSGSGGYNAGYGTQSQQTVMIDGKCMPWMPLDNPSYPFGINDGKPPVAVPIYVASGSTVNISINSPGEPIPVWIYTYQTNTVKCSDSRAPVDASGTSVSPSYTAPITGSTLGSTGKRFPTYYDSVPSGLGLGGVYAAWAKKNGTKYDVIEPFAVGFGGNFTVPSGGVDTLLLGVDDDHFSDNGGGYQGTVTQIATLPDPVPDTNTDDSQGSDTFLIDGEGPNEAPGGSVLLADELAHNTAANPAYNKTNFPKMFTGTSTISSSSTTAVDSSKMDDSMNATTPRHRSSVGSSAYFPAGATKKRYIHSTAWWGGTGHPPIGVNCNTDEWCLNTLADMTICEIDGIVWDWYGQDTFTDKVAKRFQALLASIPGNTFKFAICLDKGIAGLNQTVLTAQLSYIQTQYLSDPNYIIEGGKPVIQFFGVAGAVGDTAMTNAKAATTGSSAAWMEQIGNIGKSYIDGAFGWVHPVTTGVSGTDPYNLAAIDSFVTLLAAQPTKFGWIVCYSGFNGTTTFSTAWSKNKYLPQDNGKCLITVAAHVNSIFPNSQITAIYLVTLNDYQEGTALEVPIANALTLSAGISTSTLSFSVSGGTGDETTLAHYTVWQSTDGKNLISLGTVAIGTNTFDLSTAGLTSGTHYVIYVEAVGKPFIENHMSSGLSYVA